MSRLEFTHGLFDGQKIGSIFESPICGCRSRSILSEWNLICSNSWAPQLVYTGFFVGLLIGTTAFGAFADRYGE